MATIRTYQGLLEPISQTFEQGRTQALSAVDRLLLESYWQVGRHIVEFEQGGRERAEYGKALLDNLSHDLKLRHGRGFSRSNLVYMRQFYLVYPKGVTLSDVLSWSHVIELLKIDDPLERVKLSPIATIAPFRLWLTVNFGKSFSCPNT